MKTKKKILKLFLFAGLIGAATVAFTPILNENYNNLSIANAEALEGSSEQDLVDKLCVSGVGVCYIHPNEYWGLQNKKD